MSITVQSRAWTEGKIRGNLCVLTNNRTEHHKGQSTSRHFSFSASSLRALTLWPQFWVVSYKVKSISPESGKDRSSTNTWLHYISNTCHTSSWNDERLCLSSSYILFIYFILLIFFIYTHCARRIFILFFLSK